MDGWVDGCQSQVKDCLQQSIITKNGLHEIGAHIYRNLACAPFCEKSMALDGWVDGWVDGWMVESG